MIATTTMKQRLVVALELRTIRLIHHRNQFQTRNGQIIAGVTEARRAEIGIGNTGTRREAAAKKYCDKVFAGAVRQCDSLSSRPR
jgi:hypothetical protein